MVGEEVKDKEKIIKEVISESGNKQPCGNVTTGLFFYIIL
jgi:hypothetical protein